MSNNARISLPQHRFQFFDNSRQCTLINFGKKFTARGNPHDWALFAFTQALSFYDRNIQAVIFDQLPDAVYIIQIATADTGLLASAEPFIHTNDEAYW